MEGNPCGIVMFDKPDRQRTNISSLKGLLKASSEITEKQTIIFTSIDTTLNDNEKIELNQLIEDLDTNSYNLIRLNDREKVIRRLR